MKLKKCFKKFYEKSVGDFQAAFFLKNQHKTVDDKTDQKVDDKTDKKEIDKKGKEQAETTYMPDLESEESPE